MNSKISLIGMNEEELEQVMSELGEPRYRVRQLMTWIYKGKAFEEMSNLPESLRNKLAERYSVDLPTIRHIQSASDGTKKYLLSYSDRETVETVFLPEESRNTVCVSTQVGCAMGCTFCATGMGGYLRNLTAGEIVGQVLVAGNDTGSTITNVVMMGMGEPLANYDNTLEAVRLLNKENGLNIGMRRIVISTCGLVPQIKRLAKEKMQLVLAISLHAPTDSLRSSMMPVNKRYPLDQLIEACRDYIEETGRRVSFEYALVHGVNDSPEHARQLATLLKGLLCHVNLIPLNPVAEAGMKRSAASAVETFRRALESKGIETTVRVERGADIDAACGQLRRRGSEL